MQSYPQKTALFLSTPSARRATSNTSYQRAMSDIFLSTPSARRATYAELTGMLAEKFLSTPSARRATLMVIRVPPKYSDFYPRPPRGGRRLRVMSRRGTWLFLSTPSARRATFQRDTQDQNDIHFYPRPPRGGRPGIVCLEQSKITYFYPRPPRGGRRLERQEYSFTKIFLSTPSARRATKILPWPKSTGTRFLSTPSARRATDLAGAFPQIMEFLSTPSARRATVESLALAHLAAISIHALREEGDVWMFAVLWQSTSNFYPRPPRGGRPTSPATRTSDSSDFYPRPPRGGRPTTSGMDASRTRFLSTPSARRATSSCQTDSCGSTDFYPRPPRGGRHALLSCL